MEGDGVVVVVVVVEVVVAIVVPLRIFLPPRVILLVQCFFGMPKALHRIKFFIISQVIFVWPLSQHKAPSYEEQIKADILLSLTFSFYLTFFRLAVLECVPGPVGGVRGGQPRVVAGDCRTPASHRAAARRVLLADGPGVPLVVNVHWNIIR